MRRRNRTNRTNRTNRGSRGFRNNRLNEAAIGVQQLDRQRVSRSNYQDDIYDEETEYLLRNLASNLAQTHRHQDVALLRDLDPVSSGFSGEDEVTKIAKLLVNALRTRADDVGTVLDRDIDTGGGMRGSAARIGDGLRRAETGLDRIQRRNYGLSESQSFINRRRSSL